MTNIFFGKDFISVDQIKNKKDLEYLFNLADSMKKRVEDKIQGRELENETIVILFYQPSSRTFSSFYSAARWLGCQRVIGIQEMQKYSSVTKGESLPDTIRTFEATTAADLFIIRHPDNNSSTLAAQHALAPVINAGSGTLEHPTQAVLDLYTIREELGRISQLIVTMVGDLKFGRTVKSLARLLAVVSKDVQINLVSPETLKIPKDLTKDLQKRGVKIYETENLEDVLPETDVLYSTRIQKEWFAHNSQLDLYQKLKGSYVITDRIVKIGKREMIIMHPFPRVDEIDSNVDLLKNAAYFRQMRNGLYIRMALLTAVLGKDFISA